MTMPWDARSALIYRRCLKSLLLFWLQLDPSIFVSISVLGHFCFYSGFHIATEYLFKCPDRALSDELPLIQLEQS